MADPETRGSFHPGDSVVITRGPLREMLGLVEAVDLAARRLRVVVSHPDREIPVELDFRQVEVR